LKNNIANVEEEAFERGSVEKSSPKGGPQRESSAGSRLPPEKLGRFGSVLFSSNTILRAVLIRNLID